MPVSRTCFLPGALGVALSFAGLLAQTEMACGAVPEFTDPPYHSLRYNDDFTYLADPAKASDPWDQFKYIPIGEGPYGPSYVSLGGEVRERFEAYLNPNFGLHAPPSNAYLLHRLLLDADVHVTDHLRAFFQLGEMERLGDRGVTSTTDIDHLDLMQAFVDLRPPGPIGDAPVVRVGREGSSRLPTPGLRSRGAQCAARLRWPEFNDRIDGATIDLIAVRPVSDNTGVFDDHTNMKQSLSGAYLTIPVGPVLKTDIYWLDYEMKRRNTAA